MFTSKNLLSLPYFTLLSSDENHIELQSNNTKHCWFIDLSTKTFYTLMHKHHMDDEYHIQSAFPSLFDIVLDIVSHDEYQLRGRRPVKYAWQNRNSYFDELIKEYGLYA